MAKKLLIVATNGVEDIELTTVYDLIQRAGIDVDIAFDTNEEYITTAQTLRIRVELTLEQAFRYIDDYDALYIPGGPGAEKLDRSEYIDDVIKYFFDKNYPVAAICAGPILLAKRGYLKGKKAICFNDKSLRKTLTNFGAIIENPKVTNEELPTVLDGKILTGSGPRQAVEFADELAFLIKKKK